MKPNYLTDQQWNDVIDLYFKPETNISDIKWAQLLFNMPTWPFKSETYNNYEKSVKRALENIHYLCIEREEISDPENYEPDENTNSENNSIEDSQEEVHEEEVHEEKTNQNEKESSQESSQESSVFENEELNEELNNQSVNNQRANNDYREVNINCDLEKDEDNVESTKEEESFSDLDYDVDILNLVNFEQVNKIYQPVMNNTKDYKKIVNIKLNHSRKNYINNLEKIKNFKNSISFFVKSILKKIKNSSLSFSYYEISDIFNDFDEILDLDTLVFNHQIFETRTLAKAYSNKFDIYLDVSGSMSSTDCQIGSEKIERYTLAYILSQYLNRYNLVENIYIFNTQVMQIEFNDLINVVPGGGTDLEEVVQTIQTRNRPALIITDAESYIQTYIDKAYLLAIQTNFIEDKIFEIYKKKNQVAIWNNGKFKKLK